MSIKTTLLMAVRRNKSLCQFCTLQQSLCRSGASTQTYTRSSTKSIKTLSKMYFKYQHPRITLLEVKRNKETSLNHQQGTITRVYRINHNLNSHSPRWLPDNREKRLSTIKTYSWIFKISSVQLQTHLSKGETLRAPWNPNTLKMDMR